MNVFMIKYDTFSVLSETIQQPTINTRDAEIGISLPNSQDNPESNKQETSVPNFPRKQSRKTSSASVKSRQSIKAEDAVRP